MKKVRFVLMLLVVLFVLLIPVSAYAANPYKDVTSKTVDKPSYEAIAFIKSHGGWKGLVSKSRLYPNRYMTRREFLLVLLNMYEPSKVPVTRSDIRYANGKITANYVRGKLVLLARNLGYSIKWSGTNIKVTRKDAARYIKIFADFNEKFRPVK